MRAYLCDGKPRRTTLSVWFKDRLRNAAFRVTAAGVRIDATVYPRAAIGTVLLPDDRQYGFRAALVKRRGGLAERTKRHEGKSYHAGWIVLPDGRVRGRTLVSGTSLNGSTPPAGAGINPEISPLAPADQQTQFNECEFLAQDLKATRELLKALLASKPVFPGTGATDQQLSAYLARLNTWQGAVADTRKRISVIEETIDRRCTQVNAP